MGKHTTLGVTQILDLLMKPPKVTMVYYNTISF